VFEIDLYQLRKARRASRFSTGEVARRLGKDRSTVWRYEHGQIKPAASTLFLLAELYGVTVDILCHRPEGTER